MGTSKIPVKPDMPLLSALRVFKYLDISTAHMTKNDDELLRRDDCPLVVYPYEFGEWVLVSAEVSSAHLIEYGFSAGFAQVYDAAAEAGCAYIKFDCDGFQYGRFSLHDW